MDETRSERAPTRSWRRGLTETFLVAALWLIAVGGATAQELAGALTTGVLAAAVSARVRDSFGHRGSPPAAWLRAVGSAYVKGVADTWPLLQVAVAQLRGRATGGEVRRVPFEVGEDEPADRSRRAVAALTCSLQPGSYLLGFDSDAGVALVHERIPSHGHPVEASLRRSA